jgi:exodeoxyribonuclease VII large subunit
LVAQTIEVEEQAEERETLSVLKARAETEGWLDPDRKRKLPSEPIKIGLLTGGSSQAAKDVRGSLEDEGIQHTLLSISANVEGPGAAQDMCSALAQLNEHPSKLDLIVLARGGGGPTSLWGFNDWDLAKAIVGSRVPVLTAIGHREDETLADLVADARAHTPSLVGSVLARNRSPAPAAAALRPVVTEPEALVPAETLPSTVQPRQWVTVLLTVLATLLLAALSFVIFARILG